MTSTCCVSDILKPFQGILKAMATRHATKPEASQPEATQASPQQPETDTSVKLQSLSIRKKTTREFHVWDRVKESVVSPTRLQADMQQLADTLIGSKSEPVEAEPLPDPAQLARSRTAFARAKNTHSRLKSLEVYLSQTEAKNI